VTEAQAQKRWEKTSIFWLSRATTVLIVGASIGLFFIPLTGWVHWTLEIALRTYLMFLGTVMSHEGTHGLLGRGKAPNFFWGQLALIPCMVPFANFRRTHMLHHTHTNDPDMDPDHYLNTNWWRIPFRALAMPHQWFFWLKKRGKVNSALLIELGWNYTWVFSVYGLLTWHLGWQRVWYSMGPALVAVCMLLWIPFAIMTHAGFSHGDEEYRSHNYYGHFMYWFSLGLSMHRVHHMKPKLAWIEMLPYVEKTPGPWWRHWHPRRDIRKEGSPAGQAPQAPG
jgi:fatty acid desaturase